MVKFTASVEAKQADPVMDFTMCLLNSVTTGHILHLQSRSYSQHMALGAFYDGIGDLVDAFVEAFQGKYGLLTKYPATAVLMPDMNPIDYLEYLESNNSNDLEVKVLPLNAKTLNKQVIVVGKGGFSPFGKDSILENIEVDVLKKPLTKKEIDTASRIRLIQE